MQTLLAINCYTRNYVFITSHKELGITKLDVMRDYLTFFVCPILHTQRLESTLITEQETYKYTQK